MSAPARPRAASAGKRARKNAAPVLEAPSGLPVPLEYAEQVMVFEWAEQVRVEFPDLEWLNASLNGVKLPIGLAVKMLRSGMKKGYPDLFLPCVRFRPDALGVWPGLYIELKRQRGGHLDPEQKRWRDYLLRQGYAWHEARGADHAKRVLLEYLGADAATIARLV